MCNETVGVAKKIEIEKISKEVADLVKGLDEHVAIEVEKVKKIQQKLGGIIAGKKS